MSSTIVSGVGTTAGPRIDDRLRRFIAGSHESAAEVTRLVGALAEELDLSRPSYQQVRVLLNASRSSSVVLPHADKRVVDLLGHLYDYPAPGLHDWYERYRRGAL